MKKILILGALAISATLAVAAERDVRIIQTGSGATQYTRLVAPPSTGERCLMAINGDVDDLPLGDSNPMPKPRCYKIGVGLSVTGDYIGGYVITANGSGTPGPKGDKGDTGATGPAGPPGADGAAGVNSWAGIPDKPTTFAPSAHSHAISDVTNLQNSLDAKANTSALSAYLTTSAAAAAYYPLGSNPAGYLLPAALTGYLTSASAASTYATAASVALKADASTVTTALAGKFPTPTGSMAQYLRGDGSLATFPTIPTVPVINRAVVTTAADGTFVWTLPTACASGQLPVVSLTPESATAGDAVSHRVTARTNTSVSIFAGRSAALTVLGVGLVLGVPAAVAVPIHAIAICP